MCMSTVNTRPVEVAHMMVRARLANRTRDQPVDTLCLPQPLWRPLRTPLPPRGLQQPGQEAPETAVCLVQQATPASSRALSVAVTERDDVQAHVPHAGHQHHFIPHHTHSSCMGLLQTGAEQPRRGGWQWQQQQRRRDCACGRVHAAAVGVQVAV